MIGAWRNELQALPPSDQGLETQKAVRTIPLGPRAIAGLTAHPERVCRKSPADIAFGNRRAARI